MQVHGSYVNGLQRSKGERCLVACAASLALKGQDIKIASAMAYLQKEHMHFLCSLKLGGTTTTSSQCLGWCGFLYFGLIPIAVIPEALNYFI